MNRRSFFSFLPLAPISAAMATTTMAKAPCESLAPEKALMTLNAHKPPPPPAPTPKYPEWGVIEDKFYPSDYWSKKVTSSYLSAEPKYNNISFGKGMEIQADENFDSETQVAMAVGKDGHLWLKIGDSWKRVVTE
jgi:hypothetical protein